MKNRLLAFQHTYGLTGAGVADADTWHMLVHGVPAGIGAHGAGRPGGLPVTSGSGVESSTGHADAVRVRDRLGRADPGAPDGAGELRATAEPYRQPNRAQLKPAAGT